MNKKQTQRTKHAINDLNKMLSEECDKLENTSRTFSGTATYINRAKNIVLIKKAIEYLKLIK